MKRTMEEKDKIFKASYDKNLTVHGCGYWGVCMEHDCPCSPSAKVSQGYNVETYSSMRTELLSNME